MKIFAPVVAVVAVMIFSHSAHALEIDWAGAFKSEYNFIHNYSMDNSFMGANTDPSRSTCVVGTAACLAQYPQSASAPANGNYPGGYYVPGGGSNDATWETLFLKLEPKMVVNDNVSIKSEFWVGDPIFGAFGNSVPYNYDERQYNSNFSRGSYITAQRLYAEVLSDFGTLQVGRVPLDYGLGVVWSAGNGIFDRYESTGDAVRLISKFGAFSVIPSFIVYSAGNTFGGAGFFASSGASSPVYGNVAGVGGQTSYSLELKYENPDEDFEADLNFIKRMGGAGVDPGVYAGGGGPSYGPQGTPQSMNYNIWDIFMKKKIGKFSIAGEVPITNGSVGAITDGTVPAGSGGLDYSTWAAAIELDYRSSDTWNTLIKTGHASGQPDTGLAGLSNYRAFYFNPNYQIGMIMFGYQLRNLSAPNTSNDPAAQPQQLKSPYDNPIVDANYLSFTETLHSDKWTFNGTLVYAVAPIAANAGNYFFNYWDRTLNGAAVQGQGSTLGYEADFGTTYQWDDNIQFGVEAGVFFPGSFYAFSNSPTGVNNPTDPVEAVTARVGIAF